MYHYPYVYYPQNFWGTDYYRSSEDLYYRYPPEMRIPVYHKQWQSFYPTHRKDPASSEHQFFPLFVSTANVTRASGTTRATTSSPTCSNVGPSDRRQVGPGATVPGTWRRLRRALRVVRGHNARNVFRRRRALPG